MIFSPDGISLAIENTLFKIEALSKPEQIDENIKQLLLAIKVAHDETVLSEKKRLINSMLQKQRNEDREEEKNISNENEAVAALTSTIASLALEIEQANQSIDFFEEQRQAFFHSTRRLNTNIDTRVQQSSITGNDYDPEKDKKRLAELRENLDKTSNLLETTIAERDSKNTEKLTCQKWIDGIQKEWIQRQDRIRNDRKLIQENGEAELSNQDYSSALSQKNLEMLQDQLAESKATLDNWLKQYTPKEICETWIERIKEPSLLKSKQSLLSPIQSMLKIYIHQEHQQLIEQKLQELRQAKAAFTTYQAKGIALNTQLNENNKLQADLQHSKNVTSNLKRLSNALLFVVSGLLSTMLILIALHALIASAVTAVFSFTALIVSTKITNALSERKKKEDNAPNFYKKANGIRAEIDDLRKRTEEKKLDITKLEVEFSVLKQRQNSAPATGLALPNVPPSAQRESANKRKHGFLRPERSFVETAHAMAGMKPS